MVIFSWFAISGRRVLWSWSGWIYYAPNYVHSTKLERDVVLGSLHLAALTDEIAAFNTTVDRTSNGVSLNGSVLFDDQYTTIQRQVSGDATAQDQSRLGLRFVPEVRRPRHCSCRFGRRPSHARSDSPSNWAWFRSWFGIVDGLWLSLL